MKLHLKPSRGNYSESIKAGAVILVRDTLSCPVQHNREVSSKIFRTIFMSEPDNVYVVVLLFYVHGKHLRSCRDGQLT